MRKFIKHMLGNESHSSGDQRSGARTTNSTPVGDNNGSNNDGGENDGNHRSRRADSSSPHATSNDSAAVSEAVTEQSLGEQLLWAMIERRAKYNEAKVRGLAHEWEKSETSFADVAKQMKAHWDELYPVYLVYVQKLGTSAGTGHQTCIPVVDKLSIENLSGHLYSGLNRQRIEMVCSMMVMYRNQ